MAEAHDDDVATAEWGSTRLPYTRVPTYNFDDAAARMRLGEGFTRVSKILRGLPVADVAAAGACAALGAEKDHDEGWSWQHSLAVNGSPSEGALAAGSVAGDGAAAVATTAMSGAVLGAGVGGVAALVAGDATSNGLHEHWSEEIHDHGLAGGSCTAAPT